MTFVSYAQNCEDVMLRRALAKVECGFYIDVGANDPVVDSVTKAFYNAGWRGINIEPVAAWIERLRLDRPEDLNLQVAASHREGELRFFDVVGTGLSTTEEELARKHAAELDMEVREYPVAARPLDDICREHDVGEIHFLKIDVEGTELAVLEGLDLRQLRPWIVLVEATRPTSQEEDSDSWEHLVTERGYHPVWFDGLNRFYVADEHAELDSAFSTPPNYWDFFETNRERTLRLEHDRLAADNADLHRRLAEVEEGIGGWYVEKAELIESVHLWQNQVAERDAELRVTYSSRSWQVTRPLRWFVRSRREILWDSQGQRRAPAEMMAVMVDVARSAVRRVVRGRPRPAPLPAPDPNALPFPGENLPAEARDAFRELREARAGRGPDAG